MCSECKPEPCLCDCKPLREIEESRRTVLEIQKVYCKNCSHPLI